MGNKKKIQEPEARAIKAEALLTQSELRVAELEAILLKKESSLSAALSRISALESLLSKPSIPKTSSNSHKPPSMDLNRKNQSLREKSDKPVGGQLGHEGHTLKMTDTPDEVEALYPDFCNRCGSGLAGADFKMESRRQTVDIPPVRPVTTEYQRFGTVCHCGHH